MKVVFHWIFFAIDCYKTACKLRLSLSLSDRRSWSGMAGVTVTRGSSSIKRVKQSSQGNGEYEAPNKHQLDSEQTSN